MGAYKTEFRRKKVAFSMPCDRKPAEQPLLILNEHGFEGSVSDENVQRYYQGVSDDLPVRISVLKVKGNVDQAAALAWAYMNAVLIPKELGDLTDSDQAKIEEASRQHGEIEIGPRPDF